MKGRTSFGVITDAPIIRFRRHEVVARRVDHAVVLPKRSDRSTLVLRGAAAAIWDALADPRSTDELPAWLVESRPDLASSQCADEAAEIVEALLHEGLIGVVDD